MQNSPFHRAKIIRIVGIAVAAILVIGLVGLGTTSVLKTVGPKRLVDKSTNGSAPSAAAIKSAADLIAAYNAPGAIPSLSGAGYTHEQNAKENGNVSYKDTGRNFAVTVSTPNTTTYDADKPGQQDNTKAVQDDTASFMKRQGLGKTASPAGDSHGWMRYATYANRQFVCQLSDVVPPADSKVPGYHQLACISQAELDKEYAAIEKLLALSKDAALPTGLLRIDRYVSSEDNKSLAVLTMTGTDPRSVPKLLYAAVDGRWEYIGDINSDKAESNGKYRLTPEVQAAINDPKYGNFLQNAIH